MRQQQLTTTTGYDEFSLQKAKTLLPTDKERENAHTNSLSKVNGISVPLTQPSKTETEYQTCREKKRSSANERLHLVC